MKLISCYIKNFGKLSDKNYDFRDGINSFIEDNGAGKSTLASFIKAMLYGLDNVRSTDKDFKDRTHFAPFNNQSFGGNLIFSHNNKTYRVEKTFDVKSQTKDKVKIYVDGEEKNFNKEIGEEILGLDKESFERLLFINSKDIELSSTGNIKQNLNNIIDNTTEGINFEDIIASLDKTKKKYSGKNSIISSLKDDKKDIEDIINNQEKISLGLTNKYEKRNKLKNEYNSLLKKQKEYGESKRINECWETYNSKIKKINEKKETLDKYLKKYPNGYFNEDEISKLDSLWKSLNQKNAEDKATIFDKSKLDDLNNYKEKNINSIDKLDLNKLKELDDLKNNSEQQRLTITFNEDEKLNELDLLFRDKNISNELIKDTKEKVSNYKDKKVLINNKTFTDREKDIYQNFKNDSLESDSLEINKLYDEYKENDKESVNYLNNNKNNSKIPLIIVLISICLLIVGIPLLFKSLVIGILLIVASIILIFISAFIYLKNKIDNSNNINNNPKLNELKNKLSQKLAKYSIFNDSIDSSVSEFKYKYDQFKTINLEFEEIEKDKTILNNLKEELDKFFNKFDNVNDYNYIYDLENKFNQYNDLIYKKNDYQKKLENNKEKFDNIKNDIIQILNKYNIQYENYKYSILESDFSKYNDLNSDYKKYLDNKREISSKISEINTNIKVLFDKYKLNNYSESLFNEIKDDITMINSLKKEIFVLEKEALNYKIEKKLDESNKIEEIDLDIDDKVENVSKDLAKCENDIDIDENQIDDLEDNKAKLSIIKEEINKNTDRLKLLNKLEEELTGAQNELDKKYVAPIMNQFSHYEELLGNVLNTKIEMGKDFNISLDIYGEKKSYEHLSSGQRSICALCFRLALLDNIYNKDIPFIIMDDPFINLDKKNLVQTSKMLEELSIGKQIIYFSCHESRKI